MIKTYDSTAFVHNSVILPFVRCTCVGDWVIYFLVRILYSAFCSLYVCGGLGYILSCKNSLFCLLFVVRVWGTGLYTFL